MRASKIKQLEKALENVLAINRVIDNARYNGVTELAMEKLDLREAKACNRTYAICRTMTEEEYDATDYENMMCLTYAEAIDE